MSEISWTDFAFISPSVYAPEDCPHNISSYVDKWGVFPYSLHYTSFETCVDERKDGSEYANAVED